jgi:hypothetical protein
MRIINVLEIINNIPSKIESFPIYEEQLSQEIVDKAEELFIKLIEENRNKQERLSLSEKDKDFYLSEGIYDDKYGYELYIIWSDIN